MNEPRRSTSSQTLPVFESAAKSLVVRLEAASGEDIVRLTVQGRELLAAFQSWNTQTPDDVERVRRIQELLDFTREAYEALAKVPK